jgi:hypothetical protein
MVGMSKAQEAGYRRLKKSPAVIEASGLVSKLQNQIEAIKYSPKDTKLEKERKKKKEKALREKLKIAKQKEKKASDAAYAKGVVGYNKGGKVPPKKPVRRKKK